MHKINSMLILLFAVFGTNSYALDMSQMTAVGCNYSTASGIGLQASVKTDCGSIKICKASAVCRYVDNKVFHDEFGSDRKKADEAATGWLTTNLQGIRGFISVAKRVIWSEASGSNPRFITVESNVSCATKSDKCPSALSCRLNRDISNESTFDGSDASTDDENVRPASVVR